MTFGILMVSITVIACVLLNKLSQKVGIPMLLAFIILGMLFGSDGILQIPFENYSFSEQVCSVSLIFIMFYGGFGTNWEHARIVSVPAAMLSTFGVVLTAGITGLFCHFVLHFGINESFLIGAVISSTDAASVFSILRSKRLGLKHHTDSMLELESGSNDPCSYMLTIIMMTVMQGSIQPGGIVKMIIAQLLFGVLVGVALAFVGCVVLRHFRFATAGFDMAFVIGIALMSYALAAVIGGNGYLSTYICGIIIGNVKIQNKKALVHFFDGLTGLMQVLIFFLLGLLSTPSKILPIFFPALGIMLFLTFVARPISVCGILTVFRCNIRQQLLVSFAGLRGAASIVFAIMAMVGNTALENDLFHIVFCIVLLSISFQGTFLPFCAKVLHMSDQNIDVMKTFNDYSEEVDLRFIQIQILSDHPWANCAIRDITLPPDTLIVTLVRGDTHIVPDGKTLLLPEDVVVLSAYQFEAPHTISLHEQKIGVESDWIGKEIREFSPQDGELVIMILRGKTTILPNGNTVICAGDRLVINSTIDP